MPTIESWDRRKAIARVRFWARRKRAGLPVGRTPGARDRGRRERRLTRRDLWRQAAASETWRLGSAGAARCLACGQPIEASGRGRPKQYCSSACRQSGYRRRRACDCPENNCLCEGWCWCQRCQHARRRGPNVFRVTKGAPGEAATVVCPECGSPVTAHRSTRKTCSDRCRKRRERGHRRYVTLREPDQDAPGPGALFWDAMLEGLAAPEHPPSLPRTSGIVRHLDAPEPGGDSWDAMLEALTAEDHPSPPLGTSAVVRDPDAPEPGPDSWDAMLETLGP
jgi:endogenous inhibitor of DNA gyrase (YacG/DUF329 family)